ncbi:MAG: PIN domain-containing protein [Terriglobales bacterium]
MWGEVEPSEDVRAEAVRLLRAHPLGAADALQLAAACTAATRVTHLEFISFDERLAEAARQEGFRVRGLR